MNWRKLLDRDIKDEYQETFLHETYEKRVMDLVEHFQDLIDFIF